tara:strand:- start:38293 stop:39696 length:1404 start_codon:yes stop_codon:yes gene_type:complete
VKNLKAYSLNEWAFSFAFLVKVIAGFIFLYIYTDIYGNGSLSADASVFMTESKILNDVFFVSPFDYFRLLFGLGNQEELMFTYLQDTSHWDAGAQTLINDNRNIVRVHSLFHFFSFNNTANHIIAMCFVSTVAVKQFYLALKDKTLLSNTTIFLLILLFPSTLFWTSGILKEPFMFLGLGLLVRGLCYDSSVKKKWLFAIIGLFILIGFKPYVLIAIIPAGLFLFLFKYVTKRKIIASLILLMGILLIAVSLFSGQRKKTVHLLSRKQFDFKNVGKGGLHALTDSTFYFFRQNQIKNLKIEGDSVLITKEMDALILKHGSMEKPIPIHLKPTGEKWFVYFKNLQSDGFIEVTLINDSFGQLMKNIPEALINSLFRPFISDPGGWLKYPAMIETLLLFLFLIYAIINKRVLSKNKIALIVALVLFVLTLSLLIGWVTPVLGAIVRYRIPVYIALLVIAVMVIQPKKSR